MVAPDGAPSVYPSGSYDQPMATRSIPGATHEVVNQPPPLDRHDVYGADRALGEAVERERAGWAGGDLHELGLLAGSAEWIEAGATANRHSPELRTHDRFGHRIDEVRFHPAYHALIGAAVERGPARGAVGRPAPGRPCRARRRVRRVEPGRRRRRMPDLDDLRGRSRAARGAGRRAWLPAVTSRDYDPELRPVAGKRGAAGRHGDDGEAGRLRRPRQHHPAVPRPATGPTG